MMACTDDKLMQQEAAYLAALQAATALHQDGDKLTIDYAGGTLHFTRMVTDAASPLESTNWQLETFINGDSASSTVAGTTITAEFADGKVSGSAGCNQYNADYTLAGQALTISPVVTTKMACDAAIMTQEQQFIKGLGTATSLIIDGDQLRLDYPGGALVFRAADPAGS
jgi:heat shock protein HslJ